MSLVLIISWVIDTVNPNLIHFSSLMTLTSAFHRLNKKNGLVNLTLFIITFVLSFFSSNHRQLKSLSYR